ncbi:hypothetical protein RA989_21100, partial [Mycobacteroides abscessus subsp. massiliense]
MSPSTAPLQPDAADIARLLAGTHHNQLSAVGLLLVLAVCGWLNIYSAAAVVVIVAAVSVVWLYDRNVAGWAARLAGRRFTPDPLDTIAAPHDVRRSHRAEVAGGRLRLQDPS